MNTILLLLLVAASTQDQTPAKGLDKVAPGRVVLSLKTSSAVLLPHALVDLSLTVKNVSVHPVSGDFGRSLPSKIYVRKVGEPFELKYPIVRTLGPDDLRVTQGIPAKTLEPGAEWTRNIRVGFDDVHQVFLFDQPGEYELKASYQEKLSGAVLDSNVASVKVQAARGTEREAYDSLTPELALIALGWSSAPLEKLREAQRFLDRFGATPYAPIMRSGLERVLSRRESPEERRLYQTMVAEREQHPPIPTGGKEREAYNAFTPDLALIAGAGVPHHPADDRPFSLPPATLLEAGRFLTRFGGTSYEPRLRDGLWSVLKVKGLMGTRTPEETELFNKLERHR